MRNYQQHCTQQHTRRQTFLLISLLLTCLLVLCACTSTQKGRSSAPVLSAVDTQLTSEGQSEAKAFQLWITLMQNYNGNISKYNQEYFSDQKSLLNAKTDQAYQTALHTLNQHVNSIKLSALQTEAKHL